MDETAVSRGGTFLLGHDDVSTPKFVVSRERTTESDASACTGSHDGRGWPDPHVEGM